MTDDKENLNEDPFVLRRTGNKHCATTCMNYVINHNENDGMLKAMTITVSHAPVFHVTSARNDEKMYSVTNRRYSSSS